MMLRWSWGGWGGMLTFMLMLCWWCYAVHGVGWGGMLAFMFMLRWWRFVDHGVWWGGIFSIRLMLRWNCSMVEVVFEKCKNRRARLHAQCWEVHATPLKTTRRLSAPFPSSWIQSASSFIRLLTAPHRWDFCYGHPRFFWRWTLRGPPQQMWKLHREREIIYIYIYYFIYIYTAHIYIYIYSVYIMYLYIYIYAIPQNVFQNLMIHHHVHPLFEFFTWKIAIHFWVDNSIFRHTQIGARWARLWPWRNGGSISGPLINGTDILSTSTPMKLNWGFKLWAGPQSWTFWNGPKRYLIILIQVLYFWFTPL